MDKSFLLNAVIIDDEKKGISALKQLIERFTEDLRVVGEFTRAADAIPVIEHERPEVVFLDIDMPEMNGFDMLDRLSWKNFHLVFTTAHQEYGLKALKNNAVDYLLKPINPKELQLSIARIKQKFEDRNITLRFSYEELMTALHKGNRSRILINTLSVVETVDIHDIVYLEAKSNYTKILLNGGSELITRKTLKEFETQLCENNPDFIRVHHSFIINLKKVIRYLKTSEEIIMTGEIKVPLSKARRDIFFNWLNT